MSTSRFADVSLRDLDRRRVVVWGAGTEGRAAVRLLRNHSRPSSIVVVVDSRPGHETIDQIEGVDVVESSALDFSTVDVIVKSPGVSPYHGSLAEVTRSHDLALTGGTALWFAHSGGARTVAVTGSKGKSTTTSLTAHLLRAVGRQVTLAGNVGRAMLDVLHEQLDAQAPGAPGSLDADGVDAWFAVETSSFQAAEVRRSPAVGVLTALFPEHLDWHGSVDRYFQDKCNLFAHGPVGLAANAENDNVVRSIASLPPSTLVTPYATEAGFHVVGSLVKNETSVFDLSSAALRGRHNAVNVCGALSAVSISGVDVAESADALAAALATFRPLAHRLEPVGTHRGRLVVDDSLSTAPEAAIAALEAFGDRPVGIIVGGHDRGLDYDRLASALSRRQTPTWVHCVPMSGDRLVPLFERTVAQAANTQVIVVGYSSFDEAVNGLVGVVPDGGVILLSPAAPSFGQFTDYAHRGHHFRTLLGLESPAF